MSDRPTDKDARCPRCGSDRLEQFNDGPGLPYGGCFDPRSMAPPAHPFHAQPDTGTDKDVETVREERFRPDRATFDDALSRIEARLQEKDESPSSSLSGRPV